MTAAVPSAPSLLDPLRYVADVTPFPVVFVANMAAFMWVPALRDVSEVFTLGSQILVMSLAVFKFAQAWREHKGEAEAGQNLAKSAGEAARTGAALVPKLAGAAFALVGLFAVAQYARKRWGTPSEEAAELDAGIVSGKRKLSDDHAGDDGEVNGTLEGGDPVWLTEARRRIGLHERTPRGGSNPKVAEFFAHVGMPATTDARNVPWCSAYANAMIEAAGLTGTGSAMARSWLRWGQPCEPKRGAIVVFWRGTHDDGTTGHVGFVDRVNDDGTINVLGGNQRDCVCVCQFPVSRVLGYRWPRKLMATKTAKGSAVAGVGAAGTGTLLVAAETVPAPAKFMDALETVRGPLETVQDIVHGKAKVFVAGALVLITLAGVALAFYGRKDVREATGY